MARISQKQKDNEVLSRIDKRVSDWFYYYSPNNNTFRRLKKFIYQEDGQWTSEEIQQYDREDKRPRMTFNMIPRVITNLAAEFSENVPDVEVRAEHFTEVEQEKVDLMTNLLRNISLDSRNDVIYQQAAQDAWTGGYGAFRLVVERSRPGSFNFVIRYKGINDPTRCFWDPISRKADKSDGSFCGIASPMNKEEFKNKYPGIDMPQPLINESEEFVWMTDEQITIVDYWEKVPIKRAFALLSDNSVVAGEEAENVVRQKNKQIDLLKNRFPAAPVERIKIVKMEEHDDHKVMFYRVIKDKILERSEWDSHLLPIIFLPGIVKWISGRERTYGIAHWMVDAQRAYNYARSEYLYRLQLTRYEKFMATKENVAGNERAWQEAYKAKAALLYKRGPNGEIPIVLPPQQIGNDLQAEMSRSMADLQAIPGRFDLNIGQGGREISGVAIANRQRGGNLNVKEFFDNAAKAIESGARVALTLIPKVYDTERRVGVTKKDGITETTVINNQENQIPQDIYFDVHIAVGSSFAIQQAENVAKLIQLTQSNPQLHNVVDDIIVKNLDVQHSPQLVERINRWVNPQVVAAEGSKDPIVQKQAQSAQQNPAQQLAMQNAQLELQAKQQELQINQMKSQDDRIKAMATQVDALATMMNAQTNRQEAVSKGVRETQRDQAEQQKADTELQIETLKAVSQLERI